MDWKRCIIFQKTIGESLQCPANSKRKDAGAGYISFIHSVEEFQRPGLKATDCRQQMNKRYCRTKPAGINLVEIVLITLSYSLKRKEDLMKIQKWKDTMR